MRIEQKVIYDNEAMKALFRQTLRRKWTVISMIVLAVLGLFYVGAGIFFLVRDDRTPLLILLGLLFELLAFVYIPLMIKLGTKKANAQFIGTEVLYVVDESGVSVSSKYGESHYEWSFLAGKFEQNGFLGLQFKNRTTILLKKDLLTEAELAFARGIH